MLIPKKRTGYSRVTHPFATLTKKRKRLWIPFDSHVLSTPPAFILSQDQTPQQQPKTTHQKQQAKKTIQPKSQTKNGSSQKTIQQKQTPTIKKQNVPKSSASKKQKQEKTKPTPKNKASPVQSHTNKTKKHTIENTNNQTTNQPKLTGQDSSRAKNKRRESFSPAGLCARQRIQSYRPQPPASNQIP